MNTRAAEPNAWTTLHELEEADAIAVMRLRSAVELHKGEMRGVQVRGAFDAIMERTPYAPGVSYEADTIAGVPGLWCRPSNATLDHVVLYLHGGWYQWGSAKAYSRYVGHIAARVQSAIFIADYRLAPEHPYPAALADARACLSGLRTRGSTRIALAGDSAGGGLTLAILANSGATGAVVFSPVTDLSLSGITWTSRAQNDPYFTRSQAEELAAVYLNGVAAREPSASPLFGEFADLPPIRIYTGSEEVLLDDSVRYAERAYAAGVDVKLDIWQGMPHGFAASVGSFRASVTALDEASAFLRDRFAVVVRE